VSGCFDLLHSGHIRFLEEAATYGDLHVCVASDATIQGLKGRPAMFTQQERLYMVQSIRHVKKAVISRGSGHLDFVPEVDDIEPDILVVNEDGHSDIKEDFCQQKSIKYIVLARTPADGLEPRSTSDLRVHVELPFRINLAGGWLDQTWVSTYAPGPVVVVNIAPTHDFSGRSGMATSTRATWEQLRRQGLAMRDHETLAKVIFGYENMPGVRRYLSGSQDHIGLTHPGISALHYDGEVWPYEVKNLLDDNTCDWLEQNIQLISLGQRDDSFDPLQARHLSGHGVMELANAAERCWHAILNHDVRELGQALTFTHLAITDMLPGTTNDTVEEELANVGGHGASISGAGGGGFMVVASKKPIPGGIRVKVRRQA
jgi:cytidyltransferase-like protein